MRSTIRRARRPGIRLAVVTTLMTCVAGLTGFGQSSGQQATDGDPNSALRFKTNEAANKIRSLNVDNEQFVAAAIDGDAGTVTVYTVGQADGTKVDLGDVESTTGIKVITASAVMSDAMESRIFDTLTGARERLKELGVHLVVIRVAELGGPIVIEYGRDGVVLNEAVLRAAADEDWPQEIFDSRYVTFAEGDAHPFDGSRISDQTPLSGGARIHGPSVSSTNHDFAKCTTGFAVKSTDAPGYWVTTAWHCYKPANPVMYNQWASSGNFTIGGVSSTVPKYDTAFVKIGSSRTGAPWIYNGPPLNNVQKMRVVNALAVAKGDEYCVSGAAGYNRFGAIVQGPFAELDTANEYTGQIVKTAGFTIKQKDNKLIGGSGDSGGPVYSFANPEGTTITARGTVSGGVSGYILPSCPAGYLPGSQCAYALYITPATVLTTLHHVYFAWN